MSNPTHESLSSDAITPAEAVDTFPLTLFDFFASKPEFSSPPSHNYINHTSKALIKIRKEKPRFSVSLFPVFMALTSAVLFILYSIFLKKTTTNETVKKNLLSTERNFIIPPPGHSAANTALVSFYLLQLIPKKFSPHSLKRLQMLSTQLDTLPHFLLILLSSLGCLLSLLFLHLSISLLLLLPLSKKF